MMDKLFILSLLGLLLVTAYGAAGKMVYTDLDVLDELENFDVLIDDDDDTKLLDWPSFTSRHSGKNLVNVDTFGAAGDGVSDDTQVCLFHKNNRLSRYLKRYHFYVWNETYPQT